MEQYMGKLEGKIARKKAFISTDVQGFTVPGNVPVRAHLTLDPWLASAGVTFKY